MAVVDAKFREWIAEFKKANPSAADSRAILDTAQYAFAAGRAAQRGHDAALRAAPELLEALEPFAHATLTHTGQVIGLMREDFERAIAAIAKATGEPANSHGAGVSE